MVSPNLPDLAVSVQSRRFPETLADRDAVLQQLERILAHPSFKHSKRYPNLLQFLVVRTLAGESQLKERTLGVEVFGRDPDYDTNEDPVVRITAGEIRKRIAQYYHEPGHEPELRIDLPAGSYHPEFHLPADRLALESSHHPVSVITSPVEVIPARRGFFARRPVVYALLAILAVAAVVGTAQVKAWVAPKALDVFWNPLLEVPGSALVVIGGPIPAQSKGEPLPADFSITQHIYDGDHINVYDANTLFRLAQLFGSHGKVARLQTAKTTTLTDLRQGPIVLVAGYDNAWTMRISDALRYHFSWDPARNGIFWVEDRNNSSRHDWSVNFNEKYSELTQDYAIVSRFSDPTTGQPVVVAAGIGENGTIAAGEFLTDSHEMAEATSHAPRNWQSQNVEFVIATQVIEGKSACPRVLAAYYW
jgi:hypothetical protein